MSIAVICAETFTDVMRICPYQHQKPRIPVSVMLWSTQESGFLCFLHLRRSQGISPYPVSRVPAQTGGNYRLSTSKLFADPGCRGGNLCRGVWGRAGPDCRCPPVRKIWNEVWVGSLFDGRYLFSPADRTDTREHCMQRRSAAWKVYSADPEDYE